MVQKLYRLWVVLLIVSGGIALYFCCLSLAAIWKKVNLSEQVPAKVLSLQVKPLPSSRFGIEIEYSYEVDATTYNGKMLFEKPAFLNRFSAENQVLLMASTSQIAYYSKRNAALSSLENEFPYKRSFQALMTLSVFIYFYFARGLLLKFVSALTRDHEVI